MNEPRNNRRDLKNLSRFKALKTARSITITMLLTLAVYTAYFGYTLIPFYLGALLALLPSFLLTAMPEESEPLNTCVHAARSLGYSKSRFQAMSFSFSLTLMLLLLWFTRFLKHPPVELWIKYSPAILIISALLIYTIGQYYYFHLFHQYMMNNQIKKIK